jgi:2-C-methyl-D-erythritol 4-phosphate cytidylyltransferase
MTIEAHMADGRVLVFPDGTRNTVTESTVKRLIAEKAAQQTAAAATSIEK